MHHDSHLIEEVVVENRRRRAAISREFDPVSGLNSTGIRFEYEYVNGGETRRVWLPESMCGSRALADADEEAIDRERILHDFPYWAATRAYIKCKGGGEDVLFRLNRAQRRLVGVLEAMRQADIPIRLILLKARQWGGSTCIQLYMAWLQLVHRTGLNSLIIAHQGAATDEIKDMFDRLVNGLCDADLPGGKQELHIENVGRSRSIFRVVERNAKVKVGTAERPDSCRGGDYSLVHCSEVGVWKTTVGKTPEQMIRSACSGVLLQPLTMIVYESTANGTGNFFHREYEAAKRGESQFRPLFVPWYEIDQYSMPLDDEYEFARQLVEGKDMESTVSDRRQPGSYLWWLWEKGATLEAINWYVGERSKYGEHGLMAAEYPSDDVEAFVHSGARVFDKYKVEALRGGCRELARRGELYIPAVNGIPFDYGHSDAMGQRRALERVAFRAAEAGDWQIWRMPEDGGDGIYHTDRYVVSVDVGGRSAKADWSVVVVFDRLPLLRGGGPEVVAQWRGHTDFDLLAWRAAMAAKFYGNALLVIESNTLESRDPAVWTDGDQSCYILDRLKEVYGNLYARRGGGDDINPGLPTRYGFHTNAATKPMVIATLVRVIREGLYVERDPMCLDEFLSYERRQNGSFGAIAGSHDDLLMTRAIGLHIAFHEMPRPVARHRGDNIRRRPKASGFAAW